MTPVALDIPEPLLCLLYLRDACRLTTAHVPASTNPTTDHAPLSLSHEAWSAAWRHCLVADWPPHASKPHRWHELLQEAGLARKQLRAWASPTRRALSLQLMHDSGSWSAAAEAAFVDERSELSGLVVNVIPVRGIWGVRPRADRIIVSPRRRESARGYNSWLRSLPEADLV